MKKKVRGERREVMHHEMRMLKEATEDQQRRAISLMTPESMLAWDADFEEWAHRNQLPPNGEGWRFWLMMAGRGFGKTRAGAEWIFKLANIRPVNIALVGATIADARSIMVEGVSGLLSIAHRHRKKLTWEPSLDRLKWPNGSEAKLFSGDNADGLRGPEHEFAWVLTFEVSGDDEPPTAGQILSDATCGAIAGSPGKTVAGYAAYGASMRAAVSPIVDMGLEIGRAHV